MYWDILAIFKSLNIDGWAQSATSQFRGCSALFRQNRGKPAEKALWLPFDSIGEIFGH
jgi:hypothetical protein